jgi:hypothetical protein
MTAVTPEPIMKVAMGFMAAKHLFVASEVGLFEALAARPATIEELESRTGVPSRTIAIAAAAPSPHSRDAVSAAVAGYLALERLSAATGEHRSPL